MHAGEEERDLCVGRKWRGVCVCVCGGEVGKAGYVLAQNGGEKLCVSRDGGEGGV